MELSRLSTHIVLPEARIRVRMKTNPGQFAWATNTEQFEAEVQYRRIVQKTSEEMRLFLAMQAFTVRYPNHNNRRVTYPPDTLFYAFIHPEDRTVQPIPVNPPRLIQGSLL